MITYTSSGGVFGLKMLFRLHGSAVLKSCTPAVLSSILYVLLFQFTEATENDFLDNPYPMGALVAAFSFLLIFRANFAYNRYWEANAAIHTMHSKWLDMATELTAFHLQSACYASMKPPSFGEHTKTIVAPSLVQRRQSHAWTPEELENVINGRMEQEEQKQPDSFRSRLSRSKSISQFLGHSQRLRVSRTHHHGRSSDSNSPTGPDGSRSKRATIPLSTPNHTVKTTTSKNRHTSDFYDPHHADAKGSTPRSTFWSHVQARLQEGHMGNAPAPLFLEAVAHLLSLMSAVALSTLRNDIDEAESPLAEFRPSAPWPFVDPDRYTRKIRRRWAQSEHRSYTILRYLLGLSRTDKSRRLYNMGRPFRVIGNVSDEEIKALQAARGPQAKVTLISFWLQELITREHLSGYTGKVGPPIISHLYPLVSEGMAGYNQARKVAYIPFPFPHAQLTTLFVLVILGFIPLLMLTYVDDAFFGFVWNWLTVMCFTGLHEVARELENPFQNVPNEIPLNNFQAQFNEGLMVMFFGYHPDAYWLKDDDDNQDGKDEGSDKKRNSAQPAGAGMNRPKFARPSLRVHETTTDEDSKIAMDVPLPSMSPLNRMNHIEIKTSLWHDSTLMASSTPHDSVDAVAQMWIQQGSMNRVEMDTSRSSTTTAGSSGVDDQVGDVSEPGHRQFLSTRPDGSIRTGDLPVVIEDALSSSESMDS